MRVSDAKLRVKVDVNDYFEAFIRVDLQDSNATRAFTAQEAYIRWKNVCNSGFSLLVGRTSFVFGGGNEADSVLTGFYGGDGEGQIGMLDRGGVYANTIPAVGAGSATLGDLGDGMFGVGGGFMPTMLGYDLSRTTQITGSWQSQDGKFLAEASLYQGIDTMRYDTAQYNRGANYRRSLNYGLGSGSARLTWKPIEGLKLVGSFANMYQNVSTYDEVTNVTQIPCLRTGANEYTMRLTGDRASSNDTAVNFHIAWNPCFLPAFKIWGAYVHNWNAGWVDDLDASMYHLGISYNFTDKLSAYAIGEYMNHKNGKAVGTWYKSRAWASYAGVKYNLGYGVNMEAGWRHEDVKFKGRTGGYHTKADMDTIYAHLGFSF